MNRTLSRTEILERVDAKVAAHKPIIVATAGNGLIARSLEAGGIDFVLTSVTGLSRQRGLPSIGWRMDQNNQAVAEIVDELRTVLTDTPLVASLGAAEVPTDADLGELVSKYVAMGYSGVLNYPTLGNEESHRFSDQHDQYLARADKPDASDYALRVADAIRQGRIRNEANMQAGRGYPREIELIRAAHAQGVFTIAYAFTGEQAKHMIDAGADVIIGHCGGTAGGSAGEALMTHEEAAAWLNEIFAAAKAVKPDVLLMGHGGPFSSPDDTRRLYELTAAIGFLSGSAIERIPVEKAVREAVTSFEDIDVPNRTVS